MHASEQLNGFEIVGKLGEGAFGQVYKVKRKQDGQVYALKKIKMAHMKSKDKENALNQVRILASCKGQNIIKYKQSFYDESNQCLCIILEFASKGDLLNKIQKVNKENKYIEEGEIWRALVEISKGLYSLHSNKILHRDLKSANVFIMEDGTYKLGDLNVSKVVKHDLARTQTGTPYYTSPQVWKDRPYGAKSDMWALGCVLYEMAAQKPPFLANDFPGLYRKIVSGYFPRIPLQYSNSLQQIITKLLSQNPNNRPTALKLLQSPQITKNYGEMINIQQKQSTQLLKTIKPANSNWKNINYHLPKSKYQIEEQLDFSKQLTPKAIRKYSESIEKRRPSSAASKQCSVKQLCIQQKKINNFICQAYDQQIESKKEHMNQVKAERYRVLKKKDRVYSAGKIRISERILSEAKEYQEDSLNENKKKDNHKILKKNLPPLPSPSPSPVLNIKKMNAPPIPKPLVYTPSRKYSRKSSRKSLSIRCQENKSDKSLKKRQIKQKSPIINLILKQYRQN